MFRILHYGQGEDELLVPDWRLKAPPHLFAKKIGRNRLLLFIPPTEPFAVTAIGRTSFAYKSQGKRRTRRVATIAV